MSNTIFAGSKKQSGGGSAKPDTFFTEDSIEAVLGLSEGPIVGLKDSSALNFFVGDTPMLNVDGGSNFENFVLTVNKGGPFGELIVPRLGGGSSTVNVQTDLSYNTPVVRQGQLGNIDWLELRFIINALYRDDKEDGPVKQDLRWRVEYKPASASGWLPAVLYSDPGLDTQESEAQTIITKSANLDATAVARRQVVRISEAEPLLAAPELALGVVHGQRAIWWNGKPADTKVWRSGGWYTPEALKVTPSKVSWIDASYFRSIDPNRAVFERSLFFTQTIPVGAKLGDLWLSPSPLLWFNGAAWVEVLPALGEYDPLRGEVVAYADGVVSIKEKISSAAVKELRVRVARINEPYQVRVTKLSEDSDEKNRRDMQWESIGEINSDPLIFPNLATVHLSGRASDQFSSIPDFWGVYQGRIIRVPSNYDPVSRTHTGNWDGTWKLAYSNNPAYIVYDLVMNDRYGICSTYPVELDPFDVYEAGLWCDLRVGPNKRPQFTYNGLVAEPRGGREMVTFIAGIFGGRYFDDGNGYARLKIDKDENAVHLFTKEKVKGGVFTYAYTAMETRKNDLTVAFVNPAMTWKEDRRRVFDQTQIDTYGRVPDDFIAVGCTNEEEAIARARQKMISDLTEIETVTFETNRTGLYLEPYDIVLVADDAMDEVVTGRTKGKSGARTIQLRDEVYLEAGFTHKLLLSGFENDEYKVHTFTIASTSVARSTTQLSVTTNLPDDLPEQAVFSIDTGDKSRPFRILKLDPVDGEPDNISITAIQVNRNKWTQVHNGSGAVTVEIPVFDTAIPPVSNLRITPRVETIFGRAAQYLNLSWDRHPNKFVRRYEVYHRFNDGQWISDGEMGETSFDLEDVKPGIYTFSVRAISFTGQKSREAFIDIDLRGQVRPVQPVSNLRLVNVTEVVLGVWHFEGTEARFAWDEGTPDPLSGGYEISVYNAIDELVRTETVAAPEWTYTLSRILEDSLTRRFSVAVAARDVYGNKSAEAKLFVFNPAPPVLSPQFAPSYGVALLNWQITQPLDYVGTLIWVSDEPGVDTSLEPAYDIVAANQAQIPLEHHDFLYVRMAGYDHFGKTELNISGELVVFDLDFNIDFTPPGIPTGFKVSSEIQEDGTALVSFDWDANPEDDIAGYRLRVRVREKGGQFTQIRTDEVHHEQVMPAGLEIEAGLAAYDRFTNMSPETDLVPHVVARDTIPPGIPQNLKLRASFVSFWLEWDQNPEADMARYEVEVSGGAEPVVYPATANVFQIQGEEAGETRTFRVRAVDTSGNPSDWSEAKTDKLAFLDINATGMAAPMIVDELPLPITPASPKKVFLTKDSRFYVQRDGEWVDETSVKLLTGQLVSEQIADLAVSRDKLDNAAVDRSKLTFGAVGNTQIGPGAISSPKMRSNAVTTKKLRASTILSHHLTTAVILAEHMDVDSVTAQAIKTGTLLARHFTSESVSTEALQARVITADKVAAQNVITLAAQIANAIIGDAHIDTLSAGKIRAGTALLGSVTVNNQALSTIQSNANDPAARINQASTSILPGKISLQGSTMLTSWIYGGNGTEINGGAIAANTIKANAVEIGLRGIAVEGVEFEFNKPGVNQLSWTAGAIGYVNDDGASVKQAITAGSLTWTGKTHYVYWAKDAGTLTSTTDIVVALDGNNVILAAYLGGTDLVGNYGRTIIDGGQIKADSITALQLKSISIETRHLAANIVNSTHVQTRSLGANSINTVDLIANSALIENLVANSAKLNLLRANVIAGRVIAAGNLVVGADYGSVIASGGTYLSDIKNTAANASATANSAHGLASQDVAYRVNTGTTTINGGMLTADSVDAIKVRTGTLTADKIVANGITETFASTRGDQIGVPAGQWVTVNEMNFVCQAGYKVLVSCPFDATLYSTGALAGTNVRLLIDGNDVGHFFYSASSPDKVGYLNATHVVIWTAGYNGYNGGGVSTLTLQVQGGSLGNTAVKRSSIIASVYKR